MYYTKDAMVYVGPWGRLWFYFDVWLAPISTDEQQGNSGGCFGLWGAVELAVCEPQALLAIFVLASAGVEQCEPDAVVFTAGLLRH